jgi:ABC-2 type transport system ATP-binding protein
VSIATKNVYKKYGSRFVLEDLSLNVDQGSIYGFLGQNGAGKTTTIKLLSGLSIPTQGQIFIAGMDLFSESEKIKHILAGCLKTKVNSTIVTKFSTIRSIYI